MAKTRKQARRKYARLAPKTGAVDSKNELSRSERFRKHRKSFYEIVSELESLESTEASEERNIGSKRKPKRPKLSGWPAKRAKGSRRGRGTLPPFGTIRLVRLIDEMLANANPEERAKAKAIVREIMSKYEKEFK